MPSQPTKLPTLRDKFVEYINSEFPDYVFVQPDTAQKIKNNFIIGSVVDRLKAHKFISPSGGGWEQYLERVLDGDAGSEIFDTLATLPGLGDGPRALKKLLHNYAAPPASPAAPTTPVLKAPPGKPPENKT
jgi:hypothetical protein